MTKLGLLGAAVMLSTALAAPALAQEVVEDPGYCAQFYPNANCQNLGPGNPYTDGHARAGAIATAPFRGDSNAYYNNGDRSWTQSYAQRNGFVCQPGTWFRGEDGRQRICQ